jgi:hypothetical protein
MAQLLLSNQPRKHQYNDLQTCSFETAMTYLNLDTFLRKIIQIARENTLNRTAESYSNSLRRTRIFVAFDVRNQRGLVPVTDLCNQVNIPRRTAYRWLAERHAHREQVLRRRYRPRST